MKTRNLTPYKKVVLELESKNIKTLTNKGYSEVAAKAIKKRSRQSARTIRLYIKSIGIVSNVINKNK